MRLPQSFCLTLLLLAIPAATAPLAANEPPPGVHGRVMIRAVEGAGFTDDVPAYSPDGRWIDFNSDRAGTRDIWRIPTDGAGPDDARAERITSDDREDRFPHPSPDGKWLIFLTFEPGTEDYPGDRRVAPRLMPLPGPEPGVKPGPIRELGSFRVGRGTINASSWTRDGTRFALALRAGRRVEVNRTGGHVPCRIRPSPGGSSSRV